MQPIDQLNAPGGCWTTYDLARQFHATAQPIPQPWPEPIAPRFLKSIPPSGSEQLSSNMPVVQRMWPSIWPLPPKVQLRKTIGPECSPLVAANHTLSAFTEHRSIRIWSPL